MFPLLPLAGSLGRSGLGWPEGPQRQLSEYVVRMQFAPSTDSSGGPGGRSERERELQSFWGEERYWGSGT